jgi:hypothetical protein
MVVMYSSCVFLDSTKSAVPVEQTLFNILLLACSGHFYSYLGDQPHWTGENDNLLFLWQMLRSHWTVSWTKLLSVFLGALAFDMDYARRQDGHNKQIYELGLHLMHMPMTMISINYWFTRTVSDLVFDIVKILLPLSLAPKMVFWPEIISIFSTI